MFSCFCLVYALCRVFIPNYISRVKVQLVDCNTRNRSAESCPVVLKIRSRAPPVHNSSALDCREWSPCELETTVPSWEHWYYILVERYLSTADVYFRIGVQVTGKIRSLQDQTLCLCAVLTFLSRHVSDIFLIMTKKLFFAS